MKSYTDIEQSKKLAKILPTESADMCYRAYKEEGGIPDYQVTLCPYQFASWIGVPCWSLAKLLDILPETIEDEYGEYDLQIDMIYKKPEYVRVCDCYHSDFPSWEWDDTKELLDNIVEAVIWLNNNGYLRDEKLY